MNILPNCTGNSSTVYCERFWGIQFEDNNVNNSNQWIAKDKTCRVEQKKNPKVCHHLNENGRCKSNSSCSNFVVHFAKSCTSNDYTFCDNYGGISLLTHSGSSLSLQNVSGCKIRSSIGKRVEQYCDSTGKCDKSDCLHGIWVENFTAPNLCISNRSVYCEPYGAIRLKYPYSSQGIVLHDDDTCLLSHGDGVLVGLEANNQQHGNMLAVRANSLMDGNALVLENYGNGLTTGSLMKLQSNATDPSNGIVQVNANNVRSEKVMSINADALSDGTAVYIANKGSKLSGVPSSFRKQCYS